MLDFHDCSHHVDKRLLTLAQDSDKVAGIVIARHYEFLTLLSFFRAFSSIS